MGSASLGPKSASTHFSVFLSCFWIILTVLARLSSVLKIVLLDLYFRKAVVISPLLCASSF